MDKSELVKISPLNGSIWALCGHFSYCQGHAYEHLMMLTGNSKGSKVDGMVCFLLDLPLSGRIVNCKNIGLDGLESNVDICHESKSHPFSCFEIDIVSRLSKKVHQAVLWHLSGLLLLPWPFRVSKYHFASLRSARRPSPAAPSAELRLRRPS